MPDIYVHRYKDWDYSGLKGAKRRWFYRINGRPSRSSSAFDRACVHAAERIWRRRALRQRRDPQIGEQLELFARTSTDDVIKLMMPTTITGEF